MSSPGGPSTPARGGPLLVAVLVAAALTLLACMAAAWYGVAWYRVSNDESVEVALIREDVLRDARQAAINLNTLDHRSLQEDFDRWEQVTTGAVLEELQNNRDSYASAVAAARTSSTATIAESAVADLNAQSGSARVLVGVDVTYRPEEGPASCVLQRLLLEMNRGESSWKVDQLAPVGTATPIPGPCAGTSPDAGPPN